MPRRAARDDRDVLDRGQLGVRDRHLLEEDPPGVERHAPEHRVAHRLRLLEDLLEHEVLESGLLGLDRVPQHPLRAAVEPGAREVREGRRRPA